MSASISWAGRHNTSPWGFPVFLPWGTRPLSGQLQHALGYTANRMKGAFPSAIDTADADYSVSWPACLDERHAGAIVLSDGSTTILRRRARTTIHRAVRRASSLSLTATMTVGVQVARAGAVGVNFRSQPQDEFPCAQREKTLLRATARGREQWQYLERRNKTTRHIGPMGRTPRRIWTDDGRENDQHERPGRREPAGRQALDARTDGCRQRPRPFARRTPS